MLQPRSVRQNPENDHPPFWFYGESIRTSIFNNTATTQHLQRRDASARLYIHKEELKPIVRELLACTQPNRHETFTELWNLYRRMSSRGQRAQIRFSWGARGDTDFHAWFAHCYCGSASYRNAVVVMSFTVRHSSGSLPKVGCHWWYVRIYSKFLTKPYCTPWANQQFCSILRVV